MELSFDAGTAERFARGVWGLLSFIALIIYLRWHGDHSSARDEPIAKPPDLSRQATGFRTGGEYGFAGLISCKRQRHDTLEHGSIGDEWHFQ